MAILGLGKTDTSKKQKKTEENNQGKSNDAQADEAKAMLEQMEAKKDADQCPFC